jgi:hypothetical protein
MKYCPLCDAEYGQIQERCSVCGVDLVVDEMRGRPLDEQQRKERIQVVWRGGDPAAVSEVIHVLREAGIRHHVQPTNEHLVFELGMPRPKYAVRVFASDAAKSKDLLSDIRESAPFAVSEMKAAERDAGPESQMEEEVAPRRTANSWNPAAGTIEVWSGDDSALAVLLEACLRENQIGVHKAVGQSGSVRLLVMPTDEPFAREIIREVREATPPV